MDTITKDSKQARTEKKAKKIKKTPDDTEMPSSQDFNNETSVQPSQEVNEKTELKHKISFKERIQAKMNSKVTPVAKAEIKEGMTCSSKGATLECVVIEVNTSEKQVMMTVMPCGKGLRKNDSKFVLPGDVIMANDTVKPDGSAIVTNGDGQTPFATKWERVPTRNPCFIKMDAANRISYNMRWDENTKACLNPAPEIGCTIRLEGVEARIGKTTALGNAKNAGRGFMNASTYSLLLPTPKGVSLVQHLKEIVQRDPTAARANFDALVRVTGGIDTFVQRRTDTDTNSVPNAGEKFLNEYNMEQRSLAKQQHGALLTICNSITEPDTKSKYEEVAEHLNEAIETDQYNRFELPRPIDGDMVSYVTYKNQDEPVEGGNMAYSAFIDDSFIKNAPDRFSLVYPSYETDTRGKAVTNVDTAAFILNKHEVCKAIEADDWSGIIESCNGTQRVPIAAWMYTLSKFGVAIGTLSTQHVIKAHECYNNTLSLFGSVTTLPRDPQNDEQLEGGVWANNLMFDSLQLLANKAVHVSEEWMLENVGTKAANLFQKMKMIPLPDSKKGINPKEPPGANYEYSKKGRDASADLTDIAKHRLVNLLELTKTTDSLQEELNPGEKLNYAALLIDGETPPFDNKDCVKGEEFMNALIKQGARKPRDHFVRGHAIPFAYISQN